MKKILLNLKTNMSIADTKKYLEKINSISGISKDFVVFLNHIKLFLVENNFNNISFGSQSFSSNGLGSFTSSNPIENILEFQKVDYFLIGHYEERKYFNISNFDLRTKISKCLESNKTPIVCFGESKIFENIEKRMQFLFLHIDEILENLPLNNNLCLAYEPIYAIGSDINIDPNEINDVIFQIKEYINKKYSLNLNIFYGGNINSSNFEEFYNLKNIDGLLIGRYSLEAKNIREMLSYLKN